MQTSAHAFELGRVQIDARARTENFPVALRVLRSDQRRHLIAIYGFARLTDEIGDRAPGDRLAKLDALHAELCRALRGAPAHEVVTRAAASIRERSLPVVEFERLIEANRRDQLVSRYATFEELLGYCALSANPIGRLVLHVFDAASEARFSHSDAVCSALQLVEHWQDVAEDYAAGRIYLPAEDLRRFGCTEAELGARVAGRRLRELLAYECERAARLLDRAPPLIRSLSGRARIAVSGFAAGGRAALDAIARRDFDVLSATPKPRRRDVALHLLRHAAGWKRGGG